MDALNRKEIRSLCTEQSFQRGLEYYNRDRILELNIDENEVTATVRGSNDYRVSAEIREDAIRTRCSCPYDYGGYCKHIIAVLLAMEDREPALERETSQSIGFSPESPDNETLIEQATADELRTFLSAVLADDREVRDRFVAFCGADSGKSHTDYKREIRRLFDDAAGRHGMIDYDTWISFTKYHDLAETHRDQGDTELATTIYRALAETIHENLDRIDDSSGHYARELERAVEGYAKTLVEEDLEHEQKQPAIEYLFWEFVDTEYGFVSDCYEDALWTLCTSHVDLEYWLELLDGYLGDFGIDPASIESKDRSPKHDSPPQSDTDIQEPTADERQSDEASTTAQERSDDVLYTSDFTDGPLKPDDFTGGTLQITHVGVGPLKLEYFVGNAFDELRIDEQTIVEEHTVDVGESGSDSPEMGIVSSPRKRSLLSTYLDLLEQLDEQEVLAALYADIYLESRTFCEQYAQLLLDSGDEQHAIEVLEDGIETFRSPKRLRWLAADLYQANDLEAYLQSLKRLFVDHAEWAAYDELNAACDNSEWANIYREFETEFAGDDTKRLIAMYVYEGDLQNAFAAVQDSEELSLIRQYRDPVATVDPAKYFEFYKNLLVPFAAHKTGRRHYRAIADHLDEMQDLVSRECFAEFVDFLRETHSNRPAFLDELKKAGF